ncbi:c-type cytochrome [Celeribacter sp.]|uniref:c-type cytochrome n=1 Tax=Celeribacter sp. TaxID=1890673 RepID=UPI003A9072F7
MTKLFTLTAVALIASASAAFAGDAAKGEKDFRKCKSCHMIADGDNVIVKGGKTGPNLFGVIGRTAGSVDGFRYGDSIVAAGEAGLVWTEELLVEYAADPKAFLSKQLGDAAKSKMTFKLKDASDIAAYLASVSG